MDDRVAYIYCLTHPETAAVHYLGVSVDTSARYRTHCGADLKALSERRKWIKSLGLNRPGMVVLETVTYAERFDAERRWILKLREEGHPLVNGTIGLPKRTSPQADLSLDDDLVTAIEAARIRGIHRNSILKAAEFGTLPGQKIAGRWVFKRSDVVNWKPIGHRRKKEPANG